MKVSKTIMIVLIVLGSLFATIYGYISSRANLTQTPYNVTESFSSAMAYEHVRHLVQKVGPRPAGSKSELKAAQYIHYVLQQNGWKVREQPFSKVVVREVSIEQPEQQVQLINSQNIIAELPGSRPDTIIIGAHYDSATFNAPGAVDNASGVGVLLELARVLSKEPHEETYQLIFFGAEEHGLVGSQYYASKADLSAVRWMLNMDMVGLPLEIDVAGKRSAPPELIKQVTSLAGESHIPFHLSRDSILMTRDSSQGGTSDFSPFLDQGIPALGLGIYGRPTGYYHRPEDRLDRISLEEMQKIGDYTQRLLMSVKLEKLGPYVWDELYIPFQLGKNVVIVPSHGIRFFTFFTLLITGLIMVKSLRRNTEIFANRWKKVLAILSITLVMSLIVIGLSGSGEFLWQWIKQANLVYYSYPTLFVIARIGIAVGIFVFLATRFHVIPLARDPQLYWFTGVSLLLGYSLILALVRIDLAFPFVFWLLCMNLQFLLPNILFVLVGPYFIYSIHYELLNSSQWISYYEAIHHHFLIFLGIYTLLLIPFLLAVLHVAMTHKQLSKKLVYHLRKPSLILTGLLILSLGLVPIYTRDHPQLVVVREEWSGSKDGSMHVFSNENLPRKIVTELNEQQGKSLYIPLINEKPPITVNTSVAERNIDLQRILDVVLKLNYVSEPYLISLKLKSDHPFEIHTDEFLPMSKLPKKLQLKGVKQPSGIYSIILQRTPPHNNTIILSVETEGAMSCTIEAMFPEPNPRIQIQEALLSVDYQIEFKESVDF